MGAFTDFLKVTKPPEIVKKTLNKKVVDPPGSNGGGCGYENENHSTLLSASEPSSFPDGQSWEGSGVCVLSSALLAKLHKRHKETASPPVPKAMPSFSKPAIKPVEE